MCAPSSPEALQREVSTQGPPLTTPCRRAPTWTTGRPPPGPCRLRPGAAASGADGHSQGVRPRPAGSAAQVHVSVLTVLPSGPPRTCRPGGPPRRGAGGRGTAGGAPLWVPPCGCLSRRPGPAPLRVRRSIRPAPRSWGERIRSHHTLHLPPGGRSRLSCSAARTDGALEGLGPVAILVPGAGLPHVVEHGEGRGCCPLYKWGWLVPASQAVCPSNGCEGCLPRVQGQ